MELRGVFGLACPHKGQLRPRSAGAVLYGSLRSTPLLRTSSALQSSRFLTGRSLPSLRRCHRHALRANQRHVACLAASGSLQNPFQEAGQLDSFQESLAKIPRAGQYALAAGLTALAAAVGFLLGSRAPAPHIARIAGAAAAAALALVGLRAIWAKRIAAAGIAFRNALAVRADPLTFTRQDLQGIGSQWGVDPQRDLVQDLKSAYDAFITWIMPGKDEPLKGTEADHITAFKNALGLADEDAAPVHLDVGRRILRLRYEAGSAASDVQQRRALQKLVYVSSLVFGERKAAFLLPWKRICDMGEATVARAITDNARTLLKSELAKRGEALVADEALLTAVTALQTRLRATDEDTAAVLGEYARSNIEAALGRAIEVMQLRGQKRDVSPAITEMSDVINYCRDVESLAASPAAPKGIPRVTIHGGRLEADNKRRELTDLFRMYIEEAIRDDGEVTDELEDDVADLELILGLGKRQSEDIMQTITANAYREQLRKVFQNGDLDAAASKAAVLEAICDRLNFDAEAAAALHKQLYRQRLDAILGPKLVNGKGPEMIEGLGITDEEQEELMRLQRLFCVPASDAKQISRDVLGRIYERAVEEALSAGIDRFDSVDRTKVRGAQKALRLDEATAKDILDRAVRKAFMQYVTRARTKVAGQGQQQHAGAKELKNLVFFSNVCVAPLLEDVKEGTKQDQRDKMSKLAADMMLKAKQEVEGSSPEAAALAPTGDRSAEELVAASQEDGADADKQAGIDEANEVLQQATAHSAAEAPAEASAAAEASTSGADTQVKSLKKAQEAAAAEAATGKVGGVTMKSQKDITLAGDLSIQDRQGIYRNYLIYCMTGHVTVLPMGATVVTERDPAEFARLSQLGDILGLNPLDINSVHSEFAERAYNESVKQSLADGRLTAEKREELEKVRDQMGLSKEAAERIIGRIANQHVSSNLQQLQRMGALNLQNLLAIKESGQAIDSVPIETRSSIYSEEIKGLLTNGTGAFDEEQVKHVWPQALGLSDKTVNRTMAELAGKRKNDMLVQSVAALRTKRFDDTVKALNNVMACNKALPSDQPMAWRDKAELKDLYSVYVGREADPVKLGTLRKLLDISDADAERLQSLVSTGDFHLDQSKKEEAFF